MRVEASTLLAQRDVLKAHAAKRTKRKGALSLGPSDCPVLLARAGPTKTRPDQSGLRQFVCLIGPDLRCSAAGQRGVAGSFKMGSGASFL